LGVFNPSEALFSYACEVCPLELVSFMASEFNGINRRTFLALSAASAAMAGCSGNANQHVGVVGAGIIGASIAYHLSKAGVKVTLMERHEPATRASRGTFAWINASWAKQPRHYHSFSQDGVFGWKRLEKELGLDIKWGGSSIKTAETRQPDC